VLTEALGTFRRLGARSWAQRAQAELRACGVAVTGAPGQPDALGELTPQQRQIVRLAGDGLTDREIGDRLFLSPRTVSSHLYRSYPKLGVASRHQLRDVIARAGTPATTHPKHRQRDASVSLPRSLPVGKTSSIATLAAQQASAMCSSAADTRSQPHDAG